MNGRVVIEALEASSGPGLFDRLIADDYPRHGLASPDTGPEDGRLARFPAALKPTEAVPPALEVNHSSKLSSPNGASRYSVQIFAGELAIG